MNFLTPLVLWALFALLLPILIHLLNRRRHRTVKWAAMEFILKATRESRGKKKIKHFIILASRALAIVALVFAVAQPEINDLGTNGSGVNTVILVLDRSPSMELVTNEGTQGGGKSKREIVLEKVRMSMRDLPETRLLLLDSATNSLHDIASPEALTNLSETSASDKQADIPKLISAAINYASDPQTDYGTTEIWVASDMQASDWKIKDKAWKTINNLLTDPTNKPPKLRFISLKESTPDNKQVRVTKSLREGNEVVLETLITRTGNSEPETIQLTYAVNGGQTTEDIELTSQSKTVRKRIKLNNNTKKGHGYVSILADSNMRDNVSYFIFGEKTAIETAIVAEAGDAAELFAKATALPTFAHLSSKIYKPSQANEIDLSATPFIIWQAPLPEGRLAEDLTQYIENGGIFLAFPSKQDSDAEFLGVKWGPIQKSGKSDFFTIAEWNKTEGIFRNGIGGERLPLDQVETIKRRPLLGDLISLAKYADGETFSTRKIIGEGRALFIATLPDLTWSQLDHSAINVITIYRMLELVTERLNATGSAVIGSEQLELRARESRERLDSYTTSNSNNAKYEAGVWQLGQRVIAANRSLSEDSPETIETIEIKQAIPDVSFTLVEERGNDAAESFSKKIWRWFLYAMLLFLIIEAMLTLPAKPKVKAKA